MGTSPHPAKLGDVNPLPLGEGWAEGYSDTWSVGQEQAYRNESHPSPDSDWTIIAASSAAVIVLGRHVDRARDDAYVRGREMDGAERSFDASWSLYVAALSQLRDLAERIPDLTRRFPGLLEPGTLDALHRLAGGPRRRDDG